MCLIEWLAALQLDQIGLSCGMMAHHSRERGQKFRLCVWGNYFF